VQFGSGRAHVVILLQLLDCGQLWQQNLLCNRKLCQAAQAFDNPVRTHWVICTYSVSATSQVKTKIFPAPRLPRLAMLEIVGCSIQRACVVCVMPVVEDVVAMLCYGSPAMPKMFAPSTSFLQEI